MRSGSHERGAVTIYVTLVLAFVIFGLMVFAVDFGRIFLIQGELQTAADAAALAAASQLNGTTNALTNAGNQASAAFDDSDGHDNRFNLRMNPIANPTTLQATTGTDFFAILQNALTGNADSPASSIDWSSVSSTNPNYAKYARVQVTAQAPVLFAQFLNPANATPPIVVASAIAGPSAPVCSACGIDDLAVVDQSGGSDNVDFGFVPGAFYTLYLTASQLTTTSGATCSATAQTAKLDPNDTASVEYVILNHIPRGPTPTDGDSTLFELGAGGMQAADNVSISVPNGVPETAVLLDQPSLACPGQLILCGLNSRFGANSAADPTTNACGLLANGVGAEVVGLNSSYTSDSDGGTVANTTGSQDYALEYAGNLRRVLTLPVVDASDTLSVLGFREFLLNSTAALPGTVVPVTSNATFVGGAFRVQYLGYPVPLHCGGNSGSCTVQFGVGRTVLH